MDSIPDLFWIFSGMGVLVLCTFTGLSLVLRAVRTEERVTIREEEEV